MRVALLELAKQRLNVWYRDASHLDDAKEKSGVVFRLSKEDKACGGDGVPLTFMEFDVDKARPVDVLNTLADAKQQPTWDSHCASMTDIGDMEEVQARGFAGVFAAPPLASREAYEWQVASGNFTTEDFWLVYSTLQNDELKQRRAPDSGSVAMQNCLAAYHIFSNAKGGTHVIMTQQINSHPWPLSARDIANMAWDVTAAFADDLRAAAQKQAKLGWNQTQTVLPPWMLADKSCAAPKPSTNLKDSLLSRAAVEMARTDLGEVRADAKLPNGEVMHLWQRKEECGTGAVGAATVPVWRAEFLIPNAAPEEVFNALVSKGSEAGWNPMLRKANASSFRGGARAVHESFKSPRVLFGTFESRELWEWQAASHSLSNHTYLLALTSADESMTPPFTNNAVQAAQCLAAYEASPAPAGGTRVRMTQHVNPNVGFWAKLDFMWQSTGEHMVADFAAALSKEAQRLSEQRGGAMPTIDGGALELLATPAPGRNLTLPVADVIALSGTDFLRGFVSLDLPGVLDASSWPLDDFNTRAAEMLQIFQKVQANATEAEVNSFGSAAGADAIEVQRQGEVLAAVQLRVLKDVAASDCTAGAGLPDINGDKAPTGAPVVLAIVVAVLLVVAILATCSVCFVRRWRRLRRNRAAVAAAAMLLSDCSMSSNLAENRVGDNGKADVREIDPALLRTAASASDGR